MGFSVLDALSFLDLPFQETLGVVGDGNKSLAWEIHLFSTNSRSEWGRERRSDITDGGMGAESLTSVFFLLR